MKKFIFALATMVLGIVPAMAQDIANIPDNSVYTLDATAEAGKQVVVSFQMKNSEEVQTVQTWFALPEGFTVAKDSRERLMIKLSTARTESDLHTVYSNYTNGYYKLGVVQTSGFPFEGTEGEIFTATIDVAETVAPGEYAINLSEIELSGLSGTISKKGEYVGKITVTDPTAVTETTAADKAQVEIYNANGVKLPALQQGLNILRNVSTGKTSKVTVK